MAITPTSVFVVGTRAQLIKVAPVIVACEQAGLPVELLLTGQHNETMEDLVREFGIRTPGELLVTAGERATVLSLLFWAPAALLATFRRLRRRAADSASVNVVVHGDTASTLLGAIAGRLARAPVFHLESGLTSGRLLDPFPEELTRRLVFRLTQVALCPGAEPAAFMQRNYHCRVVDTLDNTIVDAVRLAVDAPPNEPPTDVHPYLVASLHRFQNIFDASRLRDLVGLIIQLAQEFRIHFVLHPATRKRLDSEGLLESLQRAPGVNLSPRLGYRRFLALAAGAECVLTDGGSNQEELAVIGVPTVVMRERTERSDGLGINAIMEADADGGVLEFLRQGRHHALRRPDGSAGRTSPSRLIANELGKTA
jgi:UDP-N-acetylglucosamine 2-epimerase (non-hydrolysing)